MGPFMSTFENLLVLNFSKVDKMAPISRFQEEGVEFDEGTAALLHRRLAPFLRGRYRRLTGLCYQ